MMYYIDKNGKKQLALTEKINNTIFYMTKNGRLFAVSDREQLPGNIAGVNTGLIDAGIDTYADILTKLLDRTGSTQSALADKIGMAQSRISTIIAKKNPNIRRDTRRKILRLWEKYNNIPGGGNV